jgi:hypothetical protein
MVKHLPLIESSLQTKRAFYFPKETKHSFNWGNKSTKVLLLQYGKRKDIVMINVHENEASSIDVAKKVLEQTGGLLILVRNDGERLVSFEKNTKKIQFDPNRIFTQKGLKRNLYKLNGHVTTALFLP